MTVNSSAPSTRRPSRKLIAIIAAAVVVAAALTATGVGVSRANAAETARQCTVATTKAEAASATRDKAVKAATAELTAVKSVKLPGGKGWTSTSYAKRPAVKATSKAAARPSGAEFTARVADASASATSVTLPKACVTRDDAAAITGAAATVTMNARRLDEQTAALTTDFAGFQKSENARITAEKKAAAAAAAKKAAAEAAAKKAAEEAAAEAARQAAARQTTATRSYSGGRSASSSGSGGAYTPPAPVNGQGPIGGGAVGHAEPGSEKWCMAYNGHGGTITYLCADGKPAGSQ